MSDQGPNDPGTPPSAPQWGQQQPPPPQPGQQWGQQPPPPQPPGQTGGQPPPPQQPGQQWGQPPAQQQPGQQWGQPGAMQPGQPGQPGQQQWGQQPGAGGASSGLDPKIAGILAYVPFTWLGGLVVYLVNKDPLSRFHGAQSILLSIVAIGYFILSTILQFVMPGIIDLILFLIGLGVWFGWFAASVYLAIQGYNLKQSKLPVIGDMAEQWATK